MLADVPVCATLPTGDLERARRFYGEALGLTEGAVSVGGGVFFMAAGGTFLRIYERPPIYTPAEYTVVGFLVEDLETEMSELRHRGVTFEEYDLPHSRPRTASTSTSNVERKAPGSGIRTGTSSLLLSYRVTEPATMARGRADGCARWAGRSDSIQREVLRRRGVLRASCGPAALRARDPRSTGARPADSRAAGTAVDGLRFRGEFLADGSPRPGRGRRADGARECRVLAGDLPRTHAGRSSR